MVKWTKQKNKPSLLKIECVVWSLSSNNAHNSSVSITVHGIWCRHGKKDENAPTLVKKHQRQRKLELELTDIDKEQV